MLEDQQYELPRPLIRTLEDLYTACKGGTVRPWEGKEMWFDISCGVRQVIVMSSLIFRLFMDMIMKEAYRGDPNSTTSEYADAVAVILKGISNLLDLLSRWNSKPEGKGNESKQIVWNNASNKKEERS